MQQQGSPPVALEVPAWVRIGLAEIGVVEDIRPGKSLPRIEDYHAVTYAGRTNDDVPWCSSFCCFLFESAGIRSTKSKTAASWANWGYTVPPRQFAVCVFGKVDRDAGGSGHVGICLGISGKELYLLGGNQNQRVSIATRKLADVKTWRWPYPPLSAQVAATPQAP